MISLKPPDGEALAEHLGLEAAPLGVLGEHPVEVAGEQGGLVPAGAGADLDDHVLVVVRVALDHREPQPLGELLHLLSRAGDDLLELAPLVALERAVAALEQLLGARRVTRRAAVLLHEPVRLLELAVAAGDLGVARPVGHRLGIGELLVSS